MRFSIRDIFWAILVVALCVGWWVDSRRLRMERDDYRNAAEANADAAIKNFEAYKKLQADSPESLPHPRLRALHDAPPREAEIGRPPTF